MTGTFLVAVGNMFAFGAMVRVSKNSDRTPDPTVQLIFLGMVCSWFILWFLRWYMKKFHPDFHDRNIPVSPHPMCSPNFF